MAYFNYNFATEKGITPQEISLLQLIAQQRIENNSEILRNNFNTDAISHFEQKGYITYIKAKKSSDIYDNVRLSDKGKELLNTLQIPEITENDLLIYNWLKNIYSESEREIGNAKKTKLFIALFRVNSLIDKNKLALLCKTFIEDEQNFLYSKRLEYLFFKPSNVYEKFDIEQSKLYQYYLNRQSYFDAQFEKL